MIATERIADWFAAGERVAVENASGERFELFVRVAGDGGAPWATLLHGFPTCSWDWSSVADRLAAGRRLLMVDFLGFGDSDKPRSHEYSIHEQAELVEAIWRHAGVTETALVVHDYAVSVGQELLARRAEGRSGPDLTHAAFLNGGLYPDLHRPVAIQRILRKPVLGPLVSRAINERSFTRSFRQVFAPDRLPGEAELHEHWLGVERRGGSRIYHRLIRYIDDRWLHAERWTRALERTDVPRRFVWGQLDPVSGAHMSERIQERVPADEVHALDDVGHYPQIEDPERAGALLDEFLRG